MKNLSPEELRTMSAETLVAGIASGEHSILRSIGCKKLLGETRFGRLGAKLIVRLSKFKAHSKSPDKLRPALNKILNSIAPYESKEKIDESIETGLVIAFNHPSLGEILRLMEYCFDVFPQKRMLFPVTIAWFEALAPNFDYLDSIGIRITPTITPKAISEILEVNPDAKDLADELATKLNTYYQTQSRAFVANKDVLLVAPSATRQFYVFQNTDQIVGNSDIKPETLSLITTSLKKDKSLDYAILPITVIPPEMCSAGLNLFDTYRLEPCGLFSAESAKTLSRTKIGQAGVRELDLRFRQAIADKMMRLGRSEYITEPEIKIDVRDPWTDYD